MMTTSLRLAWATRGADNRMALVLVGAVASFAFGITYSAVSGQASARADAFSAILTALLIGIDFPGAAGARFREFELSLPVAPRERARASLLLSLGFWLLPSLAIEALAQLGAFGAGARLPSAAALGQLARAGASVLLAVALRHTLGLTSAGWQVLALRVVMVGVVSIGLLTRSPAPGLLALVLAIPLLAVAHRAASRPPELRLPRAAAPAALAHTTFAALALRYCVASPYSGGLLIAMVFWTWMVTSGWVPSSTWQAMFVAMWAAYHAHYGARLLRLGHLPIARARLFRFIVWPQLVALGLGISLALLSHREAELGQLDRVGGSITLQTPQSLWQLTSGEPPIVTSPRGESHQPRAHASHLGSSLVAYDPYEVPPGASREFLLHQLGRLLADERGHAPSAQRIEERFVASMGERRSLDSARYPELRDPRRLQAPLASGALLVLLVLATLALAIHPGPALTPRERRRRPLGWLLVGSLLLVAVYQFLKLRWKHGADPVAIGVHAAMQLLSSQFWFVFPAGLALGALLYRNIRRRFEHMEAPERAKAFDEWFVHI